jgi:hypothetical protein
MEVRHGARALRCGQAASRHNSLRSASGTYSVSRLTYAARSAETYLWLSLGKLL